MAKTGRRITKHHIWPVSRNPDPRDEKNVICIDADIHDKYHTLFNNLTPPEVITYLVKQFWGGKWEYVYLAIHEQDIEK